MPKSFAGSKGNARNKNDTVFTDRNDENPSLSNTANDKKSITYATKFIPQKERGDAMRRENENERGIKKKK